MTGHKKRAAKSPGAAGAANVGGTAVELAFATSIAVHILAQKALHHVYEGAPPRRISLQGISAVDDIEVECSDGTEILLQSKRSVGLTKAKSSPLGSSIEQFVAHHVIQPEGSHVFVLGCVNLTGKATAIPALLKRFRDALPKQEAVLLRKLAKDQAAALEVIKELVAMPLS